jgi:hypothetical protein
MQIILKLHRQFMHFMKIHEKFIYFTTACCKISAQYQPLDILMIHFQYFIKLQKILVGQFFKFYEIVKCICHQIFEIFCKNHIEMMCIRWISMPSWIYIWCASNAQISLKGFDAIKCHRGSVSDALPSTPRSFEPVLLLTNFQREIFE